MRSRSRVSWTGIGCCKSRRQVWFSCWLVCNLYSSKFWTWILLDRMLERKKYYSFL
jgi:hypothetical protein